MSAPALTSFRTIATLVLLAAAVAAVLATPVAGQEVVRIAGKVSDESTGDGIAGVSVFVAGTTTGSATDASGLFEFVAARTGVVELVASAVGYEPRVIVLDLRSSDVEIPEIQLRPRDYELGEVSVEAERPRGWRRDFDRFRELFLGTSEFARSTVIVNPYVLDFRTERGVFEATASQPLEIENRALGYRISYVLGQLREGREGTAQYASRYTMYYTGQAFFEEMEPRDEREAERWAENRKLAFEGSLQHFLWALARDRLAAERFDLRLGHETELGRVSFDRHGGPAERDSLLTQTDQPGYYVLQTAAPLVVLHNAPKSFRLFGVEIPLGTGTDVSTLKLNAPTAVVHVTGYARSPFGPQNPVSVAGSMSRRRIADMLPRDYVRTWEAALRAETATAEVALAPEAMGGIVVDRDTGRPLAGAVVTVSAEGRVASVRTAGDGRFALISGDEISAVAPGYVPARVLQPAAGTDDIRIDLVPLATALLAEQGFGSNLAFLSMAEAGPRPTPGLGQAAAFVQNRAWKRAEDALTTLLEADPENLEARYYRAMAARERGKLHLPLQALLKNDAVERSRADFEILTRSHANYRDVLYQHALLEWYDGRYERAVELAHAQTVLEPGLTFAALGLLRLGQSLLRHVDPEGVRTFLTDRKAPYFRYLDAEAHRLAGRPDEAERLLQTVPSTAAAMRVPVLLARARIAFARGETAVGQQLVEAAIGGIETPLDAWFLLEDFKYLLEPGELERFVGVATAKGHIRFFRGFWTRRDPDRATADNARLAEHYARMAVAERDYYFDGLRAPFNTPEVYVQPGELAPRIDFPDAYWLNHAFDDRGLIFLRHGEPRDRVFDIGADRPNVSWRYYRNGEPMDFHFMVSELGAHDNWRLVPMLPGSMSGARAAWGYPYTDGWSPREVLHLNERTIAEGLTTETHARAANLEPLEIPHRLAAFRGANGQTLLRLYYVVPAEGARVGFAVHDRNWEEVFAEELRPRGAFVFEVEVPPDSFHLALDVSAEEGRQVGGYRWSYVAPDFRGDTLMMSDVVPLHPAVADTASDPVVWGSPLSGFDRGRHLPLYFEVYGLTFDGDDRTAYELEYRLEPSDTGGGPLGLFRRRGGAILSLTTELSGTERNTAEQTQLDLSGVRPGAYRLFVMVRDRTSGATAERAIAIDLR